MTSDRVNNAKWQSSASFFSLITIIISATNSLCFSDHVFVQLKRCERWDHMLVMCVCVCACAYFDTVLFLSRKIVVYYDLQHLAIPLYTATCHNCSHSAEYLLKSISSANHDKCCNIFVNYFNNWWTAIMHAHSFQRHFLTFICQNVCVAPIRLTPM